MPNDKPSKTYARLPPCLAKLSHSVARIALDDEGLVETPAVILLPGLRPTIGRRVVKRISIHVALFIAQLLPILLLLRSDASGNSNLDLSDRATNDVCHTIGIILK